jgi:hypothetical protein
MATPPVFTFRLPVEQAAALREMSKIYGAPTPSAFLREMVGASCSGDGEKIKAFNSKLIKGMGEQLTLKLNSLVDERPLGEKDPSVPANRVLRAKQGKAKARARKATRKA